MNRQRHIALNLLALVCACVMLGTFLPAQAAHDESAGTLINARAEGYLVDRQTAAFYGLDGTGSIADVSTTVTTYLVSLRTSTATPKQKGVRQSVPVNLRFTDSGATATVWLVYYYEDEAGTLHVKDLDTPLSGGTQTTIDATAAQDGAGRYMSLTYVFDSYGATHVALICTGISAGTAEAWVGSF